MGKLIIYHGSPNVVERPTFGAGNPHNDYGLGFYCTESFAMAQEWGCVDGSDGYANKYLFEPDGLVVLDLSSDEFNILNWLAILLDNRTVRLGVGLPCQAASYLAEVFLPEYRGFDVMRGYRADDSYFAFASAFLSGAISLEQLGRAMALGELGEQVVILSRRAFDRLEFVEAAPAEGTVFYQRKERRNAQACLDFRKQREDADLSQGLYVIDMLREGWTNDSACLRRPLSRRRHGQSGRHAGVCRARLRV